MKAPSELLDFVSTLSRHQIVLRLTMLVSPVVGLIAVAGGGGGGWLPVLVIAIATPMAALRPDSHAVIVVIAAFVVLWGVAVEDVRSPWTLVAALAVLVFHVSAALATIAPHTAKLTRATVTRWLRRTGIVAAVTATAWAAVVVLDHVSTPGNVALAAAGAVAVIGIIRLIWPERA